MIGIYKITNPEGAVYIGQSKDIEKRFYRHKTNKTYVGNSLIMQSFEKHGVEKHVFEIIEECDASELRTKERFYQDKYISDGIKSLNSILTKTEEKPFERSDEYKSLIHNTKSLEVKRRNHKNGFRVSESTELLNITAVAYDSTISVEMTKQRAIEFAKYIIKECDSNLIIQDKRDILF